MRKEKITRWDILDYLDNEESIAAYLQVVIEENNPAGLCKRDWRYRSCTVCQ